MKEMEIDLEKINHLEANVNTGTLPPPYCYAYRLNVDFKEEAIHVKYSLTYLDRDQMEEEDILEEGFTMEDDFHWEGEIPLVWKKEINEMLKKTSWLNVAPSDGYDGDLELKIIDTSGNENHCLIPTNRVSWEYFLQEMIQAIYEVSDKELPLIIRYKEIAVTTRTLVLQPVFSRRILKIQLVENGNEKEMELPWDRLKQLLKAIYLPDYDHDKAIKVEPVKNGKFLDPGEALWYKFDEGIKNPGRKSDAVARLEKLFDDFF